MIPVGEGKDFGGCRSPHGSGGWPPIMPRIECLVRYVDHLVGCGNHLFRLVRQRDP
jgi:hypothetical protein